MLIYCKAFLHLDPYHSCASVCLHLSSGLAFIPKEEPDPLGSMHIYINTAYIGSLWRPKKENHLKMGQDAMGISQNTSQYRCLCFLVNYFTKKASAALSERLFQVPLKSCHLLHSSSETPGCCQEAISNQKFLQFFFNLTLVTKAGNSFKLATIMPSMMCSCQFVVLPLEIVLPSP